MNQDANWLSKVEAWHKANKIIAYIDEVGTGSLAGPVYSCAVILHNPEVFNDKVDDSKKIKRLVYDLSKEVKEKVLDYSLGIIPIEELNATGNLNTSKLKSFKNAVLGLSVQPDIVLIDGNQKIRALDIEQHTIIKGDSKLFGIACASIIAKQERDHYMHKLHDSFPQYSWDTNVGYGSRAHLLAIKKFGIAPHHRTFFKNVKEYIK